MIVVDGTHGGTCGRQHSVHEQEHRFLRGQLEQWKRRYTSNNEMHSTTVRVVSSFFTIDLFWINRNFSFLRIMTKLFGGFFKWLKYIINHHHHWGKPIERVAITISAHLSIRRERHEPTITRTWIRFRMMYMNWATVRSAGTKNFRLSMSWMRVRGAFSTTTGIRSGYLLRICENCDVNFF